MAASSLHDDVLLILKNVTSERPSALLLAMIRWWECLGAPEVPRWQQWHRVGWDATDGRTGGAECAVWETLLEMGPCVWKRSRIDHTGA